MFERLLIANRGEIAVRVARTARRMGMHVIAVHSDADARALHVAVADEAVCIGPDAPAESYLNIAAVIAAAKETGAQAVHPGYGFLSENPAFAEACADAGLVFVGPSAAAMRAMGDKASAKAAMGQAGVPLVPGYHGDAQDDATLAREAEAVGFPLLIKASAGGGGRGMRIVEAADAFPDALAAARREAKGAFGDDRMLLERFVTTPRHIEVQVFGDSHGNAVHLYERDCSLQRRYQKVLEEAPAPGMSAARRAEIGAAAVRAAEAIGYVGAGTVEFIVDAAEDGADGPFFFMEMNTRLQVEHPVTEAVTGLDLVEWQFRVADGEALPLAQDEIPLSGHAIEARLYAEDPQRDFLPAPGRVAAFEVPDGVPGLRVDTGVTGGDTIGTAYDPMIAKVIAHGPDRAAALARLDAALAGLVCAGPVTNQAFLRAAVTHPDFASGDIDTGFIVRHRADLIAPAGAPGADTLLAALAHLLDTRARAAREAAAARGEPNSPWAACDGWRANIASAQVVRLRHGEDEIALAVRHAAGVALATLPDGSERRVAASPARRVFRDGHAILVIAGGRQTRFELVAPLEEAEAHEGAAGSLNAPMPGRVVAVKVEAGQAVKRGQTVMLLEAMKMEHAIVAPADGVVAEIFHAAGDQVAEGAELLRIEDEGTEG